MALIKTIPPEKAEGKLAELYAETEQIFGMVPNRGFWKAGPAIILDTHSDLPAIRRNE